MPKIKLLSGTHTHGTTTYLPGDEFEVNDKWAGVLNCEVVKDAALEPEKTEKEQWQELLDNEGVEYDKRWGVEKLQEVLAAHGNS